MRAFILVLMTLVSGCATTAGRFAVGATIGGGVGAVGGAVFSPNDESRPLNAALFGLGLALAGGAFGILTEKNSPTNNAAPSLRAREIKSGESKSEFEITNTTGLPTFVRERLTPVVVEEYREPDTVNEDGALHEPHKVYRIKRPAELISKPTNHGGSRNE